MNKISIHSLNPVWRWIRGIRDEMIIEITTLSDELFSFLKTLTTEKKAELIKAIIAFIEEWIKKNK